MTAKTSAADFEALVRRAGLSLTPAQTADLYGAWPHIEAMLARLRVPTRGREAEPAHIFVPQSTGMGGGQ
jgi:hypothetical protein